ncbi:MAG TPA: GNAT family N-acetyltransferase [Phycisphaerae bacterium]|nr:GNAT family N-acetyltransferase [Phycisphaerae bacterium]
MAKSAKPRRTTGAARTTARAKRTAPAFAVHPLTPERWSDFEQLFGPRGACGGCWCMWWRRPAAEFEKNKGAGNKRAMKRIVSSGETVGLIGYRGGVPVAWIALAPRSVFVRLNRARVLKPVDDTPVWSIVCLFVARDQRRSGLGVRMLREAVKYARRQRARVVEGYPVEPRQNKMPDAFAWTGLAEQFRRAGFEEVARRSATRPIMRCSLR